MNPETFWLNNSALSHITPPGDPMPEIGLRAALLTLCQGTVFEFGCGPGRLAALFPADRYHGYDINPDALVAAQARLPNHWFDTWWTPADTFLAHTVLLHLSDEQLIDIAPMVRTYPRVVIGEILGRKWRRTDSAPMVFNREQHEYEALFGPVRRAIEVPYPRYKTHLTLMEFAPCAS